LLKIDPFWADVDTVFDTSADIEAGGEGNIEGILLTGILTTCDGDVFIGLNPSFVAVVKE
jgi:hypothetical protein